MIDYEVGSTIFWVSFEGKKPFPINVYRKNGDWTYQAHGHFSTTERIEIEAFVKERLHDMYEQWKPHMKTRLTWKLGTKNHEELSLDAGVYTDNGGAHSPQLSGH